MWRECAEKHAVFQCCRASVPASTFRASAERLAVFIGSGTSKAIDLRGETPVRAPFSSVRAPDMRFRQLSRDRVPACSLCTNPASAEGMAWFARSDASKSLDSGRKTAVRALIPGGRAQQLRLWRSLFRAHYFGRGRRPPARLPSRPPDRTAGLRTLPYPDGPSPPRLARQTRSAARPNLSWTACQSPAPPHRARPGPAPPSPPGPAAPRRPRARPRPRGRGNLVRAHCPARSRPQTSRGPRRPLRAAGARAAPRLPCGWSSGTGQSERMGRRLRAVHASWPTACRWCSDIGYADSAGPGAERPLVRGCPNDARTQSRVHSLMRPAR